MKLNMKLVLLGACLSLVAFGTFLGVTAWKESRLTPADDIEFSGGCGGLGTDGKHYTIWDVWDSHGTLRCFIFFVIEPDNSPGSNGYQNYAERCKNLVQYRSGPPFTRESPRGIYVDGSKLNLPAGLSAYFVSDTQPFVQLLLSEKDMADLEAWTEHHDSRGIVPLATGVALAKVQSGAIKPLSELSLIRPPFHTRSSD